ncbi:hypothetical protein, partial [Paraburkholderia sp. Tr-20389]|uniref:hypothetical protein n=1 Tax=Paraburkholderia sp. Tr-20389 TaxID=2703903 RepID=UPI00197E5C5E
MRHDLVTALLPCCFAWGRRGQLGDDQMNAGAVALVSSVSPDFHAQKRQDPAFEGGVLDWVRSLTITYFHTGNPHYHRRGVVSRS